MGGGERRGGPPRATLPRPIFSHTNPYTIAPFPSLFSPAYIAYLVIVAVAVAVAYALYRVGKVRAAAAPCLDPDAAAAAVVVLPPEPLEEGKRAGMGCGTTAASPPEIGRAHV